MKDLESKYEKAVQNLRKIDNQIDDRLWELTQKYPQAVLYQYNTDTKGTKADVKAIIFSEKQQFRGIQIKDKLKYIKAIERHIEDQNPRKQLELDLKDPK